MLGKIGPTELIIVLLIVLLIFGPAKLPELGKALGKTIRGFKSAVNDSEAESPVSDSGEK